MYDDYSYTYAMGDHGPNDADGDCDGCGTCT